MNGLGRVWACVLVAVTIVTAPFCGRAASASQAAPECATIYFTPYAGCIGYETGHDKCEFLRLSGHIQSGDWTKSASELLHTVSNPYMRDKAGRVISFRTPSCDEWQLDVVDDGRLNFVIDMVLAPGQVLRDAFTADAFFITIAGVIHEFPMKGLVMFFQPVDDVEAPAFNVRTHPVLMWRADDADGRVDVSYDLSIAHDRAALIESIDVIAPGLHISEVSYKMTGRDEDDAICTVKYTVAVPEDMGRTTYVLNIQPIVEVTIAGKAYHRSLQYGLPLGAAFDVIEPGPLLFDDNAYPEYEFDPDYDTSYDAKHVPLDPALVERIDVLLTDGRVISFTIPASLFDEMTIASMLAFAGEDAGDIVVYE